MVSWIPILPLWSVINIYIAKKIEWKILLFTVLTRRQWNSKTKCTSRNNFCLQSLFKLFIQHKLFTYTSNLYHNAYFSTVQYWPFIHDRLDPYSSRDIEIFLEEAMEMFICSSEYREVRNEFYQLFTLAS